jgi:hypothetical protein
MTAAALIDATLIRLDQPVAGDGFYTRPETTAALNTAQRLFCFLTLCLEGTESVSIGTGNPVYAHGGIAILRITAGGLRLDRVDVGRLAARSAAWWQTQDQSPSEYAPLSATLFAIAPRPFAAMPLAVTAARYPAVLADSGASSPEIPEEHHQALADGAAAILSGIKEGGQEQAKSQRWLSTYCEAMVDVAEAVRGRSRQYRYDVQPPPLALDQIMQELMPDGPKRNA